MKVKSISVSLGKGAIMSFTKMKIAREGLVFILPALLAASAFLLPSWWPGFFLFLGVAGVLAFFFRDPERHAPGDENDVVSPADGKILSIETLASHPDLPAPVTRISIFLSLLDVHITRAPLSGVVGRIDYQPGRFFPAHSPEASRLNEYRSLFIAGDRSDIVLKQIVGVAARRIKCYLREKERIERGQKIGLMYFGSRVEIDLSIFLEPCVALHQKVRAGETLIAKVKT